MLVTLMSARVNIRSRGVCMATATIIMVAYQLWLSVFSGERVLVDAVNTRDTHVPIFTACITWSPSIVVGAYFLQVSLHLPLLVHGMCVKYTPPGLASLCGYTALYMFGIHYALCWRELAK
jgi:hypothetical protein